MFWRPYGAALASVAAVFACRIALTPLIRAEVPLMAFTLAVMWTAWNFGRGPALFANAVSTAVGWYAMLPPHFSWGGKNPQDNLRILLFVCIGSAIAEMGERQRRARAQGEADRAAKTALLAEQERLLAQVEASAERRRTLIREMFFSVTDGRLLLCESAEELPAGAAGGSAHEGSPMGYVALSAPRSVRELRRFLAAACKAAGLPAERCQDLETAVGEAGMNAVLHGGGTGEGRVFASASDEWVRVWISDRGTGISEETLHRAVLERGFSSAGTLGHGFWLILQSCDRVYLLTESAAPGKQAQQGTVILLEQHRVPPEPDWAAARSDSGNEWRSGSSRHSNAAITARHNITAKGAAKNKTM